MQASYACVGISKVSNAPRATANQPLKQRLKSVEPPPQFFVQSQLVLFQVSNSGRRSPIGAYYLIGLDALLLIQGPAKKRHARA